MKRQKRDITGYKSKAGNVGTYKIVARTKDGGRVLLESFGEKPIQFWVDKERLCLPPYPETRYPGEQTRTCWECGCDFTWRECIASGGEWSEDYCGC